MFGHATPSITHSHPNITTIRSEFPKLCRIKNLCFEKMFKRNGCVTMGNLIIQNGKQKVKEWMNERAKASTCNETL
ncbi:hypothetical protein BLOT_001164 [Blomia tropicalis]|nr:hypothetical protein BLOT_001164 [Blomia tropicalis]